MGKLAKMTKDTITLTRAEIGYLLQIAYESRDEGSYWGNRKDFIKRQNSVIEKLEKSYRKVNDIVENN
jgi:hypothetical protein